MAKPQDLHLAPGIDATNVVVVIIFLVLIIIGAYFLTRFVGQRTMEKGMNPGAVKARRKASRGSWAKPGPQYSHMVSVVDRIAVDRDKTLMVVEFAGKYYLIGTTADSFERIDRIPIPDEQTAVADDEAEAASAADREGSVQAESGDDSEKVSEQEKNSSRARTYPPDEDTFGKRFKKAFGIVLRSYLPRSAADKAQSSFDDALRARMREQDKQTKTQKKGKDS